MIPAIIVSRNSPDRLALRRSAAIMAATFAAAPSKAAIRSSIFRR